MKLRVLLQCPARREQSPPSRGAWIEITLLALTSSVTNVAPLAGGVD